MNLRDQQETTALAPSIPLMHIHAQPYIKPYALVSPHGPLGKCPILLLGSLYIDTLYLIQAGSFTYVINEFQNMKRKQLGLVRS